MPRLAAVLGDTTATIYISGPMTGLPLFNFPAFAEAAREIRSLGFAVLSPHEFDLEEGFEPGDDHSDFDLRAALERDLRAVEEADAVVVLPGWQDSPGAVLEVLLAEAYGKPWAPLDEALARARSVLDCG